MASIVFGSGNFTQVRNISEVHVSPSFSADAYYYNSGEICLLRLSEMADFGEHVQPICLVPDEMDFDGSSCYSASFVSSGLDAHEDDDEEFITGN